MSKKTRKKSLGLSPAKGLRTESKKTAQKPVSTTRQGSAPKSAKTTVRTAAKTAIKTPVKAAAQKAVKVPAKAPPARKAKSEKPSDVRAKKSKPETAVQSKDNAATPATETLAAMNRTAAPAAIPSGETAATEGGQAPTFDLPRDGGERVSLADYAGQKLVIFFYPRADTPGCTREAIDFTRLNGDFAAVGTAVLGVSADPIKTQESFRNKHQLSIPLVSDETHEMLEAYGAWGEKSMYGRTFQGVLRTTVLIDASGRIARIWRGVKVDGHADAVLATAREL
jgi:peroxiredoxin Q/BCP